MDGGGDNDVIFVFIDVGDVNDNFLDCSSFLCVVDIEEMKMFVINVRWLGNRN